MVLDTNRHGTEMKKSLEKLYIPQLFSYTIEVGNVINEVELNYESG